MPLANAGDHVPPASAEAPNNVNKSVVPPSEQRLKVVSVPALGNGVTTTVTVDVTSTHGVFPVTVKVK